ncbi:MAG: DUF1254 domain-containing protein, partial [Cyclobacteriaceae bacterium]|nr:DUF1254 domain-containing protein [Cyclobacteriaceae bacterium]
NMKNCNLLIAALLGLVLCFTFSNSEAQITEEVNYTDDEVVQLYDYLITRYLVIRQEVIDINGDFEYNKIVYNELGKATFANPNLDVAYNEAWVAVDENNPVIIEVPKIEGRYYTTQFLDEWNETFVNINPKYFDKPYGKFALCLEGVEYDLEDDITRIDMISRKAHLLARVELKDSPEEAVEYQKQFEMYVYQNGSPKIDKPTLEVFPLDRFLGVEIFEMAPEVLATAKDRMPDAEKHQKKILEIAEMIKADAEYRKHVDDVCKTKAVPFVLESVRKYGEIRNGWGKTKVIGVYGNDYFSRTVVSLIGIWANTTDEVIYFTGNLGSDGERLYGNKSYEIRFKADALPESVVDDFWSVILV